VELFTKGGEELITGKYICPTYSSEENPEDLFEK